jgi:hypothetical protein
MKVHTKAKVMPLCEHVVGMGRDRNDSGRYNDRIPPEDVLEVFDDRDDPARPLTAGDVVDALGIARRTAHNKLNALVERGALETRKVGARGRVWWVPLSAADVDQDGAGAAAQGAESGPGAPADRSDPSRPAPASAGEELPEGADVVDDALAGWEPDTQADAKSARAQTRRAVEYLREHAPERFKAGELKEALAGESSFSPRHWWERAVQPGLKHLADRGLVEYRAGYHDYQWVGDADDPDPPEGNDHA